MDTYFYCIGYSSCEESDYVYLTSDQRFSDKEFREMIEDAAIKAIKELKTKEDSYIHSYEDIHLHVVDILRKEYGFNELKVDACWSCFGWGSLFANDWKDYTKDDYNLRSLRRKVRKAEFGKKDDTYYSGELFKKAGIK